MRRLHGFDIFTVHEDVVKFLPFRICPKLAGSWLILPGDPETARAQATAKVDQFRMRVVGTVVTAIAITVLLIWLPMPENTWYLVARAYYFPLVLIGNRFGSFPGLLAGVVASVLSYAIASTFGGVEIDWQRILAPDFAVVGFLGGRISMAWPSLGRIRAGSDHHVWPRIQRANVAERNSPLNPISSIEGAAGLLDDEATPPEVRTELIGIITTECRHLSTNLLEITAAGLEGCSPRFSTVDLHSVIDSAIREVELVLSGRRIKVRKTFDVGFLSIECDREQIRALVVSLLAETIRISTFGATASIHVRGEADRVVFEIRNDAHCFPLNLLTRVLSQLRNLRSAEPALALADALAIVRNHRGIIERKIDSIEGVSFSVSLPTRRENAGVGWKGAAG